jgi:hypothetical protein
MNAMHVIKRAHGRGGARSDAHLLECALRRARGGGGGEAFHLILLGGLLLGGLGRGRVAARLHAEAVLLRSRHEQLRDGGVALGDGGVALRDGGIALGDGGRGSSDVAAQVLDHLRLLGHASGHVERCGHDGER